MTTSIAHVFRSEWTKFRSVPSNLPTLLACAVLMVGTSALTANGARGNAQAPAAGAIFDPTYISMYGGFLFVQIVVGTIGVRMITMEYATGTIRTSLTVEPRRRRLFVAKLCLVAVLTLVIGDVAAFAAFLLGQAVLGAGSAPPASLDQPGVLRAVAGMGLVWVLVGLIGMALGYLIRATMAATTVMVIVNFIIPIIGPRLLPEAVGAWVQAYWPISAGLQITTTVQDPARLSPGLGFGVLAGFTAVLLAAAFAVFRARDA